MTARIRVSWQSVRKAIELLKEQGLPIGGIELTPDKVIVFTTPNEPNGRSNPMRGPRPEPEIRL